MAAMLFGCAPTTEEIQEAEPDVPDWYLNPPSDDSEYLYVTGDAESQRRSLASDQALVDAQQDMAMKLGATVETLQRAFEEEIGEDDATTYREAFTSATRTIAQQELRGGSIQERQFVVNRETGRYEAFILYQLPIGDARDHLEAALSREEELYTRFRESQAFEELDEHLQRLAEDDELDPDDLDLDMDQQNP